MKEVRIDEQEAFEVIGLYYKGKNQNCEIPALWQEFFKRAPEIPQDALLCERSWGISEMDAKDFEDGNFHGDMEYIACVEVKNGTNPPEGMVKKVVPKSKWLVFEHHGDLSKLDKTYHDIYRDYLPGSNHKIGPWCLEMYDKRFDPSGAESSVFEIWVMLA